MQIILLEKVTNVGNLGDVVKVRDGYARNYLIPQGKARRATADNIKLLETKRSELEKAASERVVAAQAQAVKIEGMAVRIVQKAGVDGRLFGSVTNADIAAALKGFDVQIEKAAVRMPAGPLKQVGEYPLVVVLHSDVEAHIIVNVVGDTVGT